MGNGVRLIEWNYVVRAMVGSVDNAIGSTDAVRELSDAPSSEVALHGNARKDDVVDFVEVLGFGAVLAEPVGGAAVVDECGHYFTGEVDGWMHELDVVQKALTVGVGEAVLGVIGAGEVEVVGKFKFASDGRDGADDVGAVD